MLANKAQFGKYATYLQMQVVMAAAAPVAACRSLLMGAVKALDCANTSASAPSRLSVLQAAEVQACFSSTFSSSADINKAYNDTFLPIRCPPLNNDACQRAPGCILQAHGDHFDCVNRQR